MNSAPPTPTLSSGGTRYSGGVPAPRPLVTQPFHTDDLPPTPQRDRTLPADLWLEAPEELRRLGDDIAQPVVGYLRRIGRWLLWRAGPPVGADARYMAIDAEDLDRRYTFRLHADGSMEGMGADGARHTRFRTWKESLRDSQGDQDNQEVVS